MTSSLTQRFVYGKTKVHNLQNQPRPTVGMISSLTQRFVYGKTKVHNLQNQPRPTVGLISSLTQRFVYGKTKVHSLRNLKQNAGKQLHLITIRAFGKYQITEI